MFIGAKVRCGHVLVVVFVLVLVVKPPTKPTGVTGVAVVVAVVVIAFEVDAVVDDELDATGETVGAR